MNRTEGLVAKEKIAREYQDNFDKQLSKRVFHSRKTRQQVLKAHKVFISNIKSGNYNKGHW